MRNAKTLADELLARGFSLVSGGTDNHLILIDLTSKKVIGKKGAKALDAAGIVCNYNTVPYDPRKPFSPSGLRLGTPAVTSRGMGEAEMRQIGKWMDEAIAHAGDEAALGRIAAAVTEMCRKFPAPGIALPSGLLLAIVPLPLGEGVEVRLTFQPSRRDKRAWQK